MMRIVLSRSSVRCDALQMEESVTETAGAAFAIAQLLDRVGAVRRERQFVLAVREPFCQVRHLTEMPAVGRTRVLRILALDVARQFREQAPVMIDGRWERTAPNTRRFVAGAMAATLLDDIANAAAHSGWTLAFAEPNGVQSKLRWVPRRREAQQARQWRRAGVVAWIGALGVVVGTAVLVHRSLEQQRAMLAARLRALTPRAAVLERTVAEKSRMESEVRLLESDNSADPLIDRTARLLASIPDSAYVARLIVRDTGVAEMSGGAARASTLASAAVRAKVPLPKDGVTAVGQDPYRRGWQSYTLRTKADGW